MTYQTFSHEDAAQGRAEAGWGHLTWLAGAQTGNAQGLTLGRVVIKAGQSNPRHCHPGCEEVLYLMAGQLRHTVGDEAVTLNPGDTLTIPAGMFHNAVSTGAQDADMIVAYSQAERDFLLENEG